VKGITAMTYVSETKARQAGLAAYLDGVCAHADKLARRDWRAFCGASMRADKAAA